MLDRDSGSQISSADQSFGRSDESSDTCTFSGVIYESETLSYHEYHRLSCHRLSTDYTSSISAEDDQGGSNFGDRNNIEQNNFKTVDVQTDIAGIDSVIVYGESSIDSDETVHRLSTAERFSANGTSEITIKEDVPHIELEDCHLLKTTESDENEDQLVCCKCQRRGGEEKLETVDKTELETIRGYCDTLGLTDLGQIVLNQWEAGIFRIHNSCRQALLKANDQHLLHRE